MAELPAFKGDKLVKFLENLGFKIVRQKGSHIRLKHENGRVTTVPIHKGKDIPKGLLRKIIREDLEVTLEDFLKEYKGFKK